MDSGPSEGATVLDGDPAQAHPQRPGGAKLVIGDAHEGIKATMARREHFMRNALAHADKSGRLVVSAFVATAFAQDDAEAATAQRRRPVRPKLPKLADFLDECSAQPGRLPEHWRATFVRPRR